MKTILLTIFLTSTIWSTAFADEVRIQYRIKENVDLGNGVAREYNDAIYFTEAEWAARDIQLVEAEKEQRIQNWVNAVKNPPPTPQPSKEELQAHAAELQKQLDEVNQKISAKGK